MTKSLEAPRKFQTYKQRHGHDINGVRPVMIPDDAGEWVNRFDAEHLVEQLVRAQQESKEQSARIEELEAQRKLAFMACNRWRDKCVDAEKRIAELESSKFSIPAGWKIGPATATPSMVKAGGAAARKYMEETGGNNPYVIYEAMVSIAPVPELEALCVKSTDAMREVAQLCVKFPGELIDQVCLAAAEIHNRGNGVNDDKAQFIIDRIRNYLENGGTVAGSERDG
jgi:hypothetical protein